MNKLTKIIFSILILIINGIANNMLSQSIEKLPTEFSKYQIDIISNEDKLANQAGAILQIEMQNDSTWNLKIELLERNPKWKPGVDSTGGFFLRLNKTLNLEISIKAKSFKCDDRALPELSVRTKDYIYEIQKRIARFEKDAERFGHEPILYTAYFDIVGTTITSIYEQCLP